MTVLELEGDEPQVRRAERILEDYVSLVREGHVFNNGDLNSYMRVVTSDPNVIAAYLGRRHVKHAEGT